MPGACVQEYPRQEKQTWIEVTRKNHAVQPSSRHITFATPSSTPYCSIHLNPHLPAVAALWVRAKRRGKERRGGSEGTKDKDNGQEGVKKGREADATRRWLGGSVPHRDKTGHKNERSGPGRILADFNMPFQSIKKACHQSYSQFFNGFPCSFILRWHETLEYIAVSSEWRFLSAIVSKE